MSRWFGKLNYTAQFLLTWIGLWLVGMVVVVGVVALGVGLAFALGAQSATGGAR